MTDGVEKHYSAASLRGAFLSSADQLHHLNCSEDSRLLGAFGLGTIVPELHITLRIQSTFLEQLTLLCEDVFQGDTLVGEDLDKSAVVA